MMRIAILGSADGWHVRDLVRAAQDWDMAVNCLDFRELITECPVRADTLTPFDAILVRSMPAGSLEQVVYRMDALAAAERAGVRVINSPKALETCIDKYLTTHRLAAAGLPVPRTWVGERAEAAMTAFEQLGSDVVIKPLFGSEGRGIIRATERELAWRTFAGIERMQGVIYQQAFIRNPGWDLRVFVLGDRVLAAMRRYPLDGWRANVAQGARAENVSVTAEEFELAIAAARVTGCEIAGVDLMKRDTDYFVIEVNAVPGWRALSATCDVDVAKAIMSDLSGHQ